MVVIGIGATIPWDAQEQSGTLMVELPFWLMTPDSEITVTVEGFDYRVDIKEGYVEVYRGEFTDSRHSIRYFGPNPSPELLSEISANGPVMVRKCKTCLDIHTLCNSEVFRIAAARKMDPSRRSEAQWYLVSYCAAHIQIVNALLRAYILQTYDPLVHEVSPWDVPHWALCAEFGMCRVTLLDAAGWDEKPIEAIYVPGRGPATDGTPFEYATKETLEAGFALTATPGEFELARALNLRERGDYGGAVRRTATAIEVLLEARLGEELSKTLTAKVVDERLNASRNDFPGRLRQYQKLSNRILPAALSTGLDEVRTLRNEIVHRGRVIPFHDRPTVNRAMDFGRFVFAWLENSQAAAERRSRRMAQRQLGSFWPLFEASLTARGPKVYRPRYLGETPAS